MFYVHITINYVNNIQTQGILWLPIAIFNEWFAEFLKHESIQNHLIIQE